jgi:16S rRNA G966 N2-methylase RsmD
MSDPRLRNALACAREREHPYYAAAAYRLAQEVGDVAAMEEALKLGAMNYRREGPVYARTERPMHIPASYLNQIVTGDARLLAEQIPDGSIDMIFTDPVYDRIEDYAWLAETAARVLKPDRACLVWCSSVKQYEVQPLMRQHLNFVLQLTYTKVAKAYKVWGYKTFLWSTPCLWFQRGDDHFHSGHGWLIDTIIDHSNGIVSTDTPPKDSYKWHKNPEAYNYWLQRFTKPGDVVWDPFTGSGSLPVECKRHGRQFIASEIDPSVADQARRRLAQTQVPHPILDPEQVALWDLEPAP